MKKIYTYEYCKEQVEKYQSISELKDDNASMLVVIQRNKWSELLNGLKRLKHTKYTKEECIEKVRNYEYLTDFTKENESMCAVIRHNGWSDILKNLKHKGSKYKRCIYVYEFELAGKNYAYVGLTFDVEARDMKHRQDRKSSVFLFAEKNGITIPRPKQLTEYVDKEEASKLEKEYVKIYKEKGWTMLNRAKPGTLGGKETGLIYDKKTCAELAKNYELITDFAKKHVRAYQIVRINGWADEVFKHMKIFNPQKDSHRNKKVFQYTSDLKKIGEYYSISEANRKTGVKNSGISKCCNGERKTAGGFKWSFKDISMD